MDINEIMREILKRYAMGEFEMPAMPISICHPNNMYGCELKLHNWVLGEGEFRV